MSNRSPKTDPKPSAPPATDSPRAERGGTPETGNIDKIRDILFGNQVREFDRRFAKCEEHLSKVTADLREEVFRRLGALERYFQEELTTLKERLKEESEQRCSSEHRLAEELKASTEAASRKSQTIDDKLSERITDLRQRILDQSKQLSDDAQAKYDRISQEIEASAERLEESKLDRSAFSELLMDVAMRASNFTKDTTVPPKG